MRSRLERGVSRCARMLMLGLFALVSACDGGKQVATAQHPWINPPTTVDEKAVALPAWLIYRVHPQVLQEAVAELETEPYLQISPSMAAHYTQSEVRVPAEMRPFLVRGLAADNAQSTVIQSMLGLWIRVVGGDPAKLTYQPLVVLVDPTPVEIYVTVEPAG